MRFPEFEGEWESKPLREVVKINQGLQIAISERSTENKTGSYFYITNEFLKAGSGKKYYILNPPQSVICTEKDILMTRTGNTGQVVTNVSGAFHNNFFKVAYPEYIDKIFLYNFLKLNKTQNQILRFAGTSTIPDLNHSDFYRIVISFPSNIEQEKISSFLSMIDERIQAQSKIIEQLETLIRESRSKIFNQKLRFPDFKYNWKKVNFRDIATFYSGGTPLTSKKEYFDGNIPFIRSGEINSDQTEQFITDLGLKNSSAKMVDVGDILYALYGATSGEVGISKIKGAINQAVLCIKSTENHYFLYSYLVYKKESIIKTFLQGGQGNLSADIVKQLKINLTSLEEQNRIVSFLSKIDQKIQTEKAILKQLEMQKKYLLQQMFV